VVMVKARVQVRGEQAPVVPIVIPELSAVWEFALGLHAEGKPWKG
jgi:hypothetical protein